MVVFPKSFYLRPVSGPDTSRRNRGTNRHGPHTECSASHGEKDNDFDPIQRVSTKSSCLRRRQVGSLGEL